MILHEMKFAILTSFWITDRHMRSDNLENVKSLTPVLRARHEPDTRQGKVPDTGQGNGQGGLVESAHSRTLTLGRERSLTPVIRDGKVPDTSHPLAIVRVPSQSRFVNSDGCQNGLRYRFAHASHHTATPLRIYLLGFVADARERWLLSLLGEREFGRRGAFAISISVIDAQLLFVSLSEETLTSFKSTCDLRSPFQSDPTVT